MRLSVHKDDEGYLPYLQMLHRMRKPIVMLDGVEQSEVITADEERGEVLRHKTDERGNVIIAAGGHELETELLQGEVLIIEGDA